MSRNSWAKYFQNKKQKKASKKNYVKGLSEEEKNKKQQYDQEEYKNLSEDKKESLFEYRKNIAKYGEVKTLC